MSLLNAHNLQALKDFESLWAARIKSIATEKINTFAQDAPAELLAPLALGFGVDIKGLSEQAARKLIATALVRFYYEGTAWAVKTAASAITPLAQLREWWEYEGSPNHFKIDLLLKNYSSEQIKQLNDVVNAVKNVHSVYEGINIAMGDIYSFIYHSHAAVFRPKLARASTLSINAAGEFFASAHCALNLIYERSLHE